jgi:hypothetical protein
MIDKRFYEHRESDPARAVIGVALMSVLVLVVALWAGSIVTANQLGCPPWLDGTVRSGPGCLTGPMNGLLWNMQYRAFPGGADRRRIRSWPPSYRRHFYRALDASWIAGIAGFLLASATTVATAMAVFARKRNERVMIEGTRFWANDDEVFATGLAVNYRPPLLRRLFRKRVFR